MTEATSRFRKLSVLMPVYNEHYTVESIVSRVLGVPLPAELTLELIIVDDCSTDGTEDLLKKIESTHGDQVVLHRHGANQGKGAAIRTAVSLATGDICLIQDADLEYDPRDYRRVLAPLLSGDADVVYGSRFTSSEYRRVLPFWHSTMNKFLTTLSNVLTDLNMTDMETCYKAVRTSILKSIPIRSNRFGMRETDGECVANSNDCGHAGVCAVDQVSHEEKQKGRRYRERRHNEPLHRGELRTTQALAF